MAIEQQVEHASGFKLEVVGCDKLIVIFGGVNLGVGMPVFEFKRMLAAYEYDRLFVRDIHQMWYQKGVDEKFTSKQAVVDYIKSVIADGGYKEVVSIGNSMGGYAALLFAKQIGASKVLVFSPQTFISIAQRLKLFDFRWFFKILKVHVFKAFDTSYDLRQIVIEWPNDLVGSLHYSNQHRLDKYHAEHLHNLCSGLVLCPHSYKQHNLVKVLKSSGTLDIILKQFLTLG